MGSYATTATKTADQRVVLETGELGQFAAPDSIITNPYSTAYSLGEFAHLNQTIEGVTGGDVNAVLQSVFADTQAGREQVVSLAQSALESTRSLAATAQSAAGADWQQWLPFIVIAAVLMIYLGAQS